MTRVRWCLELLHEKSEPATTIRRNVFLWFERKGVMSASDWGLITMYNHLFVTYKYLHNFSFSLVVQSLSCVQLFITPQSAAGQASLSITNSQSLLKLMAIESVIPSNYLILGRPLLLPPSICPSIRVFSNESALHIRGQSFGASASASVLPKNIQGWFSLGLTGLILQSKGLSRVFSNTIVQKHQFFITQSSYIHTWLLEKP